MPSPRKPKTEPESAAAVAEPEEREPDEFEVGDGWDDIRQILSSFDGGSSEPIIHLYRRDPKGANCFVAELEPDTGPADIQRDYGGGKFLLMIRDKATNQIRKSRRFTVEGAPRFAGDELKGTPVSQAQGGLDPAAMLASGISMMTTVLTTQMQASQQAAQQQQALLLSLMENMAKGTKPPDPFDDFDRMLKISERLQGGGGSWMAALPMLEPLVEKLGAAINNPNRPRPATVVSRPGAAPPRLNPAQQAQQPQQPPQQSPQAPPAMANGERRIALAVQVMLAVTDDESADAAATAQTMASILGDDAAAALADESTAVDQLCEQFPALAARREFTEAVHAELAAMYATEGEGSDDGEAVGDAPPETEQAD